MGGVEVVDGYRCTGCVNLNVYLYPISQRFDKC